jgi:hypothetical protein
MIHEERKILESAPESIYLIARTVYDKGCSDIHIRRAVVNLFFSELIVGETKAGYSAQQQIRPCHSLQEIDLSVNNGVIEQRCPTGNR